MRILWIVTKPPWPMRDGGRVVAMHTLRALARHGHDLVLVSPFDPSRDDALEIADNLREFCEPHLVARAPATRAGALLRSAAGGMPLSIGRHAVKAARSLVDKVLATRRFDLVHVEQMQALPQAEPAHRRSLPVVLRSQNVESDLWAGLAAARPVVGGLVRVEARRLARYEGRAVRSAAATVALTARDAERLRALAGDGGSVHRVAAPFPARLHPGLEKLEGDPAVVVLAGEWFATRDGAAAFVSGVWPSVRSECPRAVLHLFGMSPGREASGVTVHPAPADSATAFPAGAIAAVSLRIASGVRVKILEAWARGVPVVASPEAAEGLDASDGTELSVARDARGFAAAIARLHRHPELARASVEHGRQLLRARHDPERIAGELSDVYDAAVARPRG